MHPLVQLLTSLGHLFGGGGAPAGPANPGTVPAINNATGFQPPHMAPAQPAPQPLVNNINRMTGMTPGAVPLQAAHQPLPEAPMFPPGFLQHLQALPHIQQLPQLSPITHQPMPSTQQVAPNTILLQHQQAPRTLADQINSFYNNRYGDQ